MSISIDQVTKRYQGASVVNDVSLEIGQGELFVLLGPSGSGKSTLLRAIAGLTGVDHGRIALHGRDVTHVAARDRGVGLVFQNYALFRHMSVADNIEFALRVRGMKASERRARRAELLRLVALEGMDERLPAQLSGGQQQRVAVARALAHKPEVLLLDEPFGALDAKIREELRRTFREVQRELGITTVLVTHDQEEAFALADRIGVMNIGRLLEVGEPNELYARPATRFVATFLGAANLLLVQRGAEGLRVGSTSVRVRGMEPLRGTREREVVAVLRPEEVELASNRETLRASFIGKGRVEELVFNGALERLRIRMEDPLLAAQLTRADGNGEALLEVTRSQHEQRIFPLRVGTQAAIGVRRIHVLPTPLSSFTVCAGSAGLAQELARQGLLTELAGRMKTRIAHCIEATAGTEISGCVVIAAQPHAMQRVRQLLQRGAEAVWVLPHDAVSPQRVLIHWAHEEARRATLAVAASLLRHLGAEALYVGIMPEHAPEASRPQALRALLDARSEAQASHGMQMRTELAVGPVGEELARRLAESPEQLLILGVRDLRELEERFGALLALNPGCPVLVVYGDEEAAYAA